MQPRRRIRRVRFASLLLVALLAGCAGGDPPRVVSVPLGEEPASTSAPPASCARQDCWEEWWNASIDADGPFTAQLPLPVLWLHRGPLGALAAPPWPEALEVEGNGRGRVESGERHVVHLRGTGDVTARLHAVRDGVSAEGGDGLLRVRWGDEPGMGRASQLDADVSGDINRVTLTFVALGPGCERRATFEGAPANGTWRLVGQDTVVCW